LRPNRFLRLSLRILLPIGILAVGILGFLSLRAIKPELQTANEEPPAYLVAVQTAQKQQVRFELVSQGTVKPKISTSLVSEVAGRVSEISQKFVSGGFFEADETLVRIDSRNYETSLKRAELALARARVRVDTERALSGYAREDWEQFIADNDPSNSPTELTLRRPQLAEVLAEYSVAEAEMKQAQDDLDRTTVSAPYRGLILEKNVDIGQYVGVGTPLASTVAADFAEVRLPISLNDLEYLTLPERPGSYPVPVQLYATIGGTVSYWDAMIVRTEGVVDTQSRVIHAVAEISDPYDFAGAGRELLRFGTFVHATIQGNDAGDMFVVPRHAVYQGSQVWIVNEDDTITPRTVTVVRFDDDYAYISEGLENGDVYCVTPIDRPLPGMKVKISG